jgi:hypothetical protein
MVDFLKVLNDYYVANRGKRIKQEFQDVLGKQVEELTGSQKQIYDIYIEPNITQLQDTLFEAFKDAGNPLEEWRESVLANQHTIINQVAKKMLIKAIREMDIGQL